MALLPVQSGGPGISPVYVGAGVSGDEVQNDGSVFLLLTATAARSLIVDSPHAGLHDYTFAFGPGGAISARFDPLRWNVLSTGRLAFHFDNPVGVTVAAVRIVLIGFDPTMPVPSSLT